MNNYKHFINYFRRPDSIATTGMGLLVAGIILFFLGWWFFWIFFYIGIPLLPVGFALYIYGSSGCADENELKKIIKQNTDVLSFADVKESPDYRKRLPRNPTEEDLGGYVYADGVLMKKAKSGAIVSSEYLAGKMLVLDDALLIRTRSFSFIADELRENEMEIPFASIESVEMERESKNFTIGKKEVTVKLCSLVISHEGVQTRLTHKDDIYADELILTLNRLLKKA